jgi:hypothetical protein
MTGDGDCTRTFCLFFFFFSMQTQDHRHFHFCKVGTKDGWILNAVGICCVLCVLCNRLSSDVVFVLNFCGFPSTKMLSILFLSYVTQIFILQSIFFYEIFMIPVNVADPCNVFQ